MIHTTFGTILDKSGQWQGVKYQLPKIEKLTGPMSEYGMDTPIKLSTILEALGVAEGVAILGLVTEGERAKSVSLCKKIVVEAVHRACGLVGKEPFHFDWFSDFGAQERLASFWAHDACKLLSSLNEHESQVHSSPLSYYSHMAYNSLSLLMRTAAGIQPEPPQSAERKQMDKMFEYVCKELDAP